MIDYKCIEITSTFPFQWDKYIFHKGDVVIEIPKHSFRKIHGIYITSYEFSNLKKYMNSRKISYHPYKAI